MLCYLKKRNQVNTPKEGEARAIPRQTHATGPSWQCTGRATWSPGRDLVEGEPRASLGGTGSLRAVHTGWATLDRAGRSHTGRGAQHLTETRPGPADTAMGPGRKADTRVAYELKLDPSCPQHMGTDPWAHFSHCSSPRAEPRECASETRCCHQPWPLQRPGRECKGD